MEIEAIILAGGFGTRLQSIIKDVPKPMVDIKGVPFLACLLDYLLTQNVNKVILSVGYKYEIIINYFGTKYKDINIEYSVENIPLGTGGALKKSLKHIKGNNALVLNGDTFFSIDIKRMINFHFTNNAVLTIAVKPMQKIDRYGTVISKENRVIDFKEKSFKPFGYINGGVYIMNTNILESFNGEKDNFSFEVDFLYTNIYTTKICAFLCNDYFIDIGIPEDYKRAQEELGVSR